MSENDAISRISDIPMPDYYLDYYSSLSDETYSIFEHAASAKSSLADSSGIIEPKIAFVFTKRRQHKGSLRARLGFRSPNFCLQNGAPP